MGPDDVKERYLWPGDILSLMNAGNRRKTFGAFLPEDFLGMELMEPVFLEADTCRRGNAINTFENEYILSNSQQSSRFLKPSGDGKYSIPSDQASAIGKKINPAMIRNITEHNRCNISRFSWSIFESDHKDKHLSQACLDDLTQTEDKAEQLMILLLFSMFQKYYSQAVGHTVRQYLSEVHKEQNPTLVVQKPSKEFKLQGRKTHDRCIVWYKPRFLDTGIEGAKKLSEVYVLPSYRKGESAPASIEDFMDQIINADVDDEEPTVGLILGVPGIGKSTLFTWFLNRKDVVSDEKRRIFHYKGKRIFLYRFSDLNQEMTWSKEDGSEQEAAVLLKQMLRLMEDADDGAKDTDLEDTILLLDGFDECAASEKQRKEMLLQMAERWGYYARIFVTCRHNYVPNTDELGDKISCVSLQTMDRTQLKEFTGKYYGSEDIPFDIDAIPDDRLAVFGIPIIWYMILSLNMDITDTTSIGTVYDKLFNENGGVYDRMLENQFWEKGRRDTEYKRINITEEQMPEYKRNLNQLSREIAHYMFANEEIQDIPLSEIQKIMEKKNLRFKDKKGRNIPLNTVLSSGLFMHMDVSSNGKKVAGTLRFVHKSMYEYFMADYLYQTIWEFHQNTNRIEADRILRTTLGSLLWKGKLTLEIGVFLRQKLAVFKRYKNEDRTYFSEFEESFLFMLNDGMTASVNLEGQDEIDEWNMNHYTFIPVRYEHYNRNVRYDAEEMIFQNMMFLTQVYRQAVDLYNTKHVLFEKYNVINRSGIVHYLKVKHYIGPNNTPFDLSGVNLSFLDLNNTDLSVYNLSNCDMRGTRLRNAILELADMSGSVLAWACLTDANMHGCSPSAKELFDNEKNGIPWTCIKGYYSERFTADHLPEWLSVQDGLVQFGSYPQIIQEDKAVISPILWRVLKVSGNRALLLSEKIIDVGAFFATQRITNSGYSTLKENDISDWLNGTFLKDAFSAEEQKKICNTLVEPYWNINKEYRPEPGCGYIAGVIKKIFLLSVQEVLELLATTDIVRKGTHNEWYQVGCEALSCEMTEYAVSKGIYKNNRSTAAWWLRTIGETSNHAIFVSSDGDINTRGTHVHTSMGIRPALWLKLF